ncbi:hypothetical protein F8M41_013638 [Gigaspora margarita]|uniref:Uncharacterized protein n=1 Tax=Gigaspora margarita TaxID=4874 RepID=A0A8H4A175_GIGMA|nr:hypothetical protein F8M41_013638 [Gigaspora margarita]
MEDFDVIVLKNAINAYKKREYKSALQTFKSLASKDYSDSTDKNDIKIYGQATFYLALCYMNGYGVIQNKGYALSIANHYTNDEIKFIVTCLKVSYNISGYNNIKRDKNEAFNLINTIKLK